MKALQTKDANTSGACRSIIRKPEPIDLEVIGFIEIQFVLTSFKDTDAA